MGKCSVLSLSGEPEFPGDRPCISLQATKHERLKFVSNDTVQLMELHFTLAPLGLYDTGSER